VAFAVDDTLVRIYYRGADETLTYSLPDFSKNSLHNTALGKAYLSALPDDLLAEKIASMELLPKTPNTIVDKAFLFEEIRKAKVRQYAMSEEEYLPGLITISAPLFDPLTGNGVGAVCFDFSVLQHSAEDVQKKYADMIRGTAKTLSEILPPDRSRRESK
jgi:DNA-binding IclR family transcriptional regulator